MMHAWSALAIAWGAWLVLGASRTAAQAPPAGPSRPVTVADAIDMTLVGDYLFEFFPTAPAAFSPDGTQFVVVTRHGNRATNTNDFVLLRFRSAAAFDKPMPDTLLTMASSSNEPAITDVHWLADNTTVVFLGQEARERTQVYSVNVRTRVRKQLTHHPTNIVAFDVAPDLTTMAYLALPSQTPFVDDERRQQGLLVSNQYLWDLVIGHGPDNVFLNPPELFIAQGSKDAARIVMPTGNWIVFWGGVSVSLDGRYVVVQAGPLEDDIPVSWRAYAGMSEYLYYPSYWLVETRTGSVRQLLNAPTGGGNFGGPPMVWGADDKFIVIGNTYLPRTADAGADPTVPETEQFAVAVDLATGVYTKIAQGKYDIRQWDARTGTLVLKTHRSHTFSVETTPSDVAYQKRGVRWQYVDMTSATAAAADRGIRVQIEQDMNTPPTLQAVNARTGAKALLLDLNPHFRELQFGKVEEIRWPATDGTRTTGGLYLPVGYIPGQRYPLVIQTHGWNPGRFEIDGESTAGYAAQTLAGKGIVVAQVPEDQASLGTSREGPTGMAVFEGLIDSLDRRGLIDRRRVGLQAWSRTGYAVRYTLSFSKYPIAAAVVVDAMEAGIMQYAIESVFTPKGVETYDGLNGGAAPFGAGLQTWIKHAPSFNLDKVHTPVRQIALGPYTFTNMWESFAGLKHLGKPVEMIWLRDANHWPLRPSERMAVQQGSVDWFCFWLKGEEDADPAKAAQYARWHGLRKQRDQQQTGPE